MLQHTVPQPARPFRVVLLGAQGFVASTLSRRLAARSIPFLALGRRDLDLLDAASSARLEELLRPDDSLAFVSALAPCKDVAMLEKNIAMANTVCRALQKRPVSHVLYVSSDAVYHDSSQPLTEESPAAPGSLHGVMHLARELMLQSVLAGPQAAPLAILRPTLIYGAGDPHNGYGPNRYARLAARGEEIVLFGEGEERRDHVGVDDVAELALRLLLHRSRGVLNATTGVVASFRELAEYQSGLAGGRSAVRGTPRNGPMPHNGYRAFAPAASGAAFPDFRFTSWQDGLRRMAAELAQRR